jgi:cytochrome d ubiquinol oxidase subunit I
VEDALTVSRLQFAFTITYHYLFPMFTMGLALLVFVLKSIYMRRGNELYNKGARFWGRIFAVPLRHWYRLRWPINCPGR